MNRLQRLLASALLLGALLRPASAEEPMAGLDAFAATRNRGLAPLRLDFTNATVVTRIPHSIALTVLVEEAKSRSLVRWPVMERAPGSGPLIVVGRRDDVAAILRDAGIRRSGVTQPPAAEGFHLASFEHGNRPIIIVEGADDRGVLYGVGCLLRSMSFGPKRAGLATPVELTTSPRFPIRGIQLGYRGMSNTYAGWTPEQYEQQIRDLAVFGANVVEMIVGFSDNPAPEFTVPYEEMMRETSRLADRYGLDYWVVSPVRDRDYTRRDEVERTLAEWEQMYRMLPRLDSVFVPGGDPGNTPPEQLLPLLAQQSVVLRRHHPNARVWVSAQGFTAAGLDYFFDYLHREKPDWLAGVVSAAWTDLSTADIRRRTPDCYDVVCSTDIGHILHCQQPLQGLDTAIAITQGREPICPRPTDMAHLVRVAQAGTVGALAYSDGATDDINKVLWAALNWNPDADPADILREYSRYFLGERMADDAAAGIQMLERNWRGSLAANEQVPTTLAHFRRLEASASPDARRNWRFLSLLYRAYYDSYTRKRLIHESALEAEANAVLARAESDGADAAIEQATRILARPSGDPSVADERLRIHQLAEGLFQTIRMKLSVPLYGATALSRGANLDSIDWPLNNRRWLEKQFAEIRRLGTEKEKVDRLLRLARWTDAGEGGFHDNPGQPNWKRRVAAIEHDDARFHRSAHDIKTWVRKPDFDHLRIEWLDHVATLGLKPLVLDYEGLDPSAEYVVRVVYGDTKLNNRVRLLANGIEVHGYQKGPVPARPQEFVIPHGAVRDGRLTLRWEKDPVIPSIKGVCHVSEIWILRKSPDVSDANTRN